jgi:hypothetical protein
VPEAAPPGSHCNGPSPSHEPGAHYLDHLLDGKAVGDHQPRSPQSTQTGEQFKPVICRCAGGMCRRLGDRLLVPDDGVQNEPLVMYPCGQLPPGPGGFGTGSGSVSRRSS